MYRVLFLVFCCLFLAACSRAQLSNESLSSLILPLYPNAQWSEAMQSQRTFIWEGREKTVSGREVRGTYDDKVQKKLFYKGSEYADEDFWRFYMGEETLSELGYEEIFKEEYQFDRQFVGLRDKEGHVLLLSNIIEFSVPFPEAPGCPCKYTFAIFTDDERVAISN